MATKAKTLREWLNELPQEQAEKAIANASKIGKIERLDEPVPAIFKLGLALRGSFPWNTSPEGHEYWKGIHNNLPIEQQSTAEDVRKSQDMAIESLPEEEQVKMRRALSFMRAIEHMADIFSDMVEEDEEPKKEKTIDELIEEAVQNEDYEKAAELRDSKEKGAK